MHTKRIAPLATLVVAALVALPGAAGAATEDIKVCKLLTKKQASTILGEKVVKAESERDAATDAAKCRYKTKKFSDDDLEELDAPILLSIDIQGVDEIAEDLAEARADADHEIEGVGDYAFRSSTGATIAVSGDLAIEAGYSNAGSTPSDVAEQIETDALELVIKKLTKA